MKTWICRWLPGWRAAWLHLMLSSLLALVLAALVFGWWYASPYRQIIGGTGLFVLVMAVDVVCGPLLTAVLLSPHKSRLAKAVDMGLIAVVQLMALAYGAYTVYVARPVFMVFETDRLRVVTYSEVDARDWQSAAPQWRTNWGKPRLIAVRAPKDTEEKLQAIEQALAGKDVAVRPEWWQPWDAQTRQQVLARARDLDAVYRKLSPEHQRAVEQALQQSGVEASAVKALPLTSSRSTGWMALVDRTTALPVAFAPVDVF